jgi:hypothetical protein
MGSVIGNRTLSKIRSMERGWRYAVDQLVALGAAEPEGDLRAWLRAELPRISRTRRSQGKHRYVWAIDRRLRKHLPASKPFPQDDQELTLLASLAHRAEIDDVRDNRWNRRSRCFIGVFDTENATEKPAPTS